MGLFMDTMGIPIGYGLFPGNTNDCETLIPILAKMKRDYGIGRSIVVADKGMIPIQTLTASIRRRLILPRVA